MYSPLVSGLNRSAVVHDFCIVPGVNVSIGKRQTEKRDG
jgi:hypothetical protein